MTIKFSAGEEAPVDVLATTEHALKGAAEDLSRLIGRIRDGDFHDAKSVPKVIGDLNRALQAVVIGSNNAQKLCKQATGSVGAGALDFHAARDEIGRRLARLRDAGSGG